jgi:AraC-like DNA-binding protein
MVAALVRLAPEAIEGEPKKDVARRAIGVAAVYGASVSEFQKTSRRPIALVRVAALKPVLVTLMNANAPIGRLLEEANLPVWTLAREESLIPLHQGVRLLEVAAQFMGVDTLGLAAGQAPIDALGFFGRLVRSARTLEEAIDTIFDTVDAFNSGEHWELVHRGDQTQLRRKFLEQFDSPYGQADQYALALCISMLRLAAGPGWTPAEVQLETGTVAALGRCRLLRHTKITFDGDATAITFPTTLLANALPPYADDCVYDGELERWRASGPARDFAGSVQQVIAALAPGNGHPRIGATADALSVSVRTLQRRLAENGLSFEGLLRSDRLETAAHLLQTTDAKVLEIALDLGYSDHAHFTRAFRRWTGMSPLAYRQASKAPPDTPVPASARFPRPEPALQLRSAL